jgi:uncharacterized protein
METTSSPASGRRSGEHDSATGRAVWLLLAGLLVVAAFYSTDSGEQPRDALYDPDLALGGVIFYAVLVGLAALVALFFGDVRRGLGFRAFEQRWLWWAAGLAVATVVVSLVLEPFLHAGEKQGLAPARWEPEHAGVFVANALITVILGPFAEETFFRGVGVRAFAALGSGLAIVATAVVFGLVHGIVEALPPLVFLGAGLAWIRIRADSVWPAIAAHTAYNGLGILFLVVFWAAGGDPS